MASKKATKKSSNGKHPVIVRAYSGVFFGYLVERNGASVTLRDARQIWSWDSAGLAEKVYTCADIAVRGVGTGSKLSAPATRAVVDQLGAMFDASPEAVKRIAAQKWGTT